MSKEAMQIALDALEANLGNWAAKTKAVEVLRQALVDADDTSQKRVDEMVKTEHDRAVELGKAYERGWNAALAQQEPVAWITDGGKGELWWYQSSKFDEEGNLIGYNPDDVPLYTAPPKKEWVGLHGSEVPDTYKYDVMFMEGWLWAEERLKEKNHG